MLRAGNNGTCRFPLPHGVLVLVVLCFIHLDFLGASGAEIRLDVVAHVPIGRTGSTVALSPDERELYVAQDDNNSVAVLNTGSRKLIRTIHVAHVPGSLAISPDGKRVYVGQWAGQSEGQLSVIDTGSGTATLVHVGGPVLGSALTSDGTTLYMAMCRAGLRKMDTRTGVVKILYRQFCPWCVALSPDENSLWVNFQGGGPNGRWGHDSIAKFDTATGKLIGTITGLPNVGAAIIVSRDGKTVWADGFDACWSPAYDHLGCPAVPASVVNVIDAATMKLIRTLPKAPSGTIAFSADQRWAALTGTHVSLIDTRDFHLVATIPGQFFDMAFSSRRDYVYATSREAPEVVIMKIRRFR